MFTFIWNDFEELSYLLKYLSLNEDFRLTSGAVLIRPQIQACWYFLQKYIHLKRMNQTSGAIFQRFTRQRSNSSNATQRTSFSRNQDDKIKVILNNNQTPANQKTMFEVKSVHLMHLIVGYEMQRIKAISWIKDLLHNKSPTTRYFYLVVSKSTNYCNKGNK